jgi:hypothetical protein
MVIINLLIKMEKNKIFKKINGIVKYQYKNICLNKSNFSSKIFQID